MRSVFKSTIFFFEYDHGYGWSFSFIQFHALIFQAAEDERDFDKMPNYLQHVLFKRTPLLRTFFFFSSLIKSLIFFFSLSCFMLHASCMHELHDVRESSKKAYDAEQIKNDIHSHCVRVGQKKNGQPHLFTYKFSFACTPVEYRYVTYSWIHARTSHTPYRIRYLLYESWTMEYINAPFERPYMAFL